MRVLLLTLLITALAVCPVSAGPVGTCSKNILSINDTDFAIAIADDQKKRSKGLMGFEEMPARAGMLFVFERSGRVGFWMKDTLIPLDIIFINEHGEITQIHEMAKPHDLTTIESDLPVRYVLEINGGLAEELGFAPGDIAVTQVIGTGCAEQ